MKTFLIILLVVVVLFVAVFGYFWITRDRYILDGPGMINEVGPLLSLRWSQSASYAEGCFQFSLNLEEDTGDYTLSANVWDYDAQAAVSCEDKKLTGLQAQEILTCLGDIAPDLIPQEDTGDSDVFALDETSVHFSLHYANRGEELLSPPSGEAENQLYTLLLNAAK